MLEKVLEIFDANTDAVATNRGFYYQYLNLLKKWLTNFIEDAEVNIYTEVDQDIKEVGNDLLFTQTKCYTSNFSLNSLEVKNTIFDFFLLYLKNKDSISDISFCFVTNTNIAPREKLLLKWFNDGKLADNDLKKLCIAKIDEILNKEVKNRKNKKLNQKNSDNKKEFIKKSAEELNNLIKKEADNFTLALLWKFENLSPDDAIAILRAEIEQLLSDEKFKNKPTSLLFGVFISEIYKRSQNKEPEKRLLTKQDITDILNHSDVDLEKYLNTKFFKLIRIEMDMLRSDIQSIQNKIEDQGFRLLELEKSVKSNSIIPKQLNSIPDYSSSKIYDWENFLNDINSKLTSQKIISIYSPGGMGKTSFAKKYIKTFTNYDHLVWVTVENSISYSFISDEILTKNLKIEFSQEEDNENCFKLILNKLDNIDGNNLIIVDIQELGNDLDSLSNLMMLSSWQKLILTRNHLKTIPAEKLPLVDIDNSKAIFYSHCKRDNIDENLLVEFINFVDYNILMIELVAKTIENSFDLTLEIFYESLKQQNLDDEEYKIDIDIADENNSVRIFNYLIKKFSLSNLEASEKNYLDFLVLLPSKDIIVEDIILINGTEYYNQNKIQITNWLNTLEKKGLIEYSFNKKAINIHKIIKEVVLYNSRLNQNPFINSLFFITWLTARIKEGHNNPSISQKYLRYAQSILDNIKEDYRRAIYQPLIMLENELLYSTQFYVTERKLDKWMDLASRAENSSFINEINRGIIYVNLGLSYSYNDNNKNALFYFEEALKLFRKEEEAYQQQIVITLNNISSVLLISKDIVNALDNFKEIQSFRKKYDLYNDQQVVIEYRILSKSYEICGDVKKAIEIMEQGIEFHYSLNINNKNDFFLSACYNYLSKLYLMEDDLDSGILYQEKAIIVFEEMQLEKSENMLYMYQIMKVLYKTKGLLEKEKEVLYKIQSFKEIDI